MSKKILTSLLIAALTTQLVTVPLFAAENEPAEKVSGQLLMGEAAYPAAEETPAESALAPDAGAPAVEQSTVAENSEAAGVLSESPAIGAEPAGEVSTPADSALDSYADSDEMGEEAHAISGVDDEIAASDPAGDGGLSSDPIGDENSASDSAGDDSSASDPAENDSVEEADDPSSRKLMKEPEDDPEILDETGEEEGFTWQISGEAGKAILTVSGSGQMPDYASAEETPWAAFRNSIASAVIAEGITGIGAYALSGLTHLTDVTLPESAQSFGKSVFAGDSCLDTIRYRAAGQETPMDIAVKYLAGVACGTNYGPDVRVTLEGSELVNGEAYEVFYNNMTEVGTGLIEIRFKGDHADYGTAFIPFEVLEAAPDSPIRLFAEVTFGETAFTYNGKIQKPSVSVTAGSWILKEGQDYEASISGAAVKAGSYTLSVKGLGPFDGEERETAFTIEKADLAALSGDAVLKSTSLTYTGSPLTPALTIKGLTKGTDYILSYSSNVSVGTATVTALGQGNYKGVIKKTFTITKAPETQTQTGSSDKEAAKEAAKTLTQKRTASSRSLAGARVIKAVSKRTRSKSSSNFDEALGFRDEAGKKTKKTGSAGADNAALTEKDPKTALNKETDESDGDPAVEGAADEDLIDREKDAAGSKKPAGPSGTETAGQNGTESGGNPELPLSDDQVAEYEEAEAKKNRGNAAPALWAAGLVAAGYLFKRFKVKASGRRYEREKP